ncbi:MAG: HNH endonuclease [Candidatus Levybacteria bacterium]|nr:HNH endonuclease [Candidatus Levybacteria bacterium]
MTQIILQPAGDGDAIKHFVETIQNPVSIDRIQSYLSSEVVLKLKNLFPSGKIPVWGVTPGKNDVNKHKWERVETGDIALFSRENEIFASATVAFTIHNKDLALNLWESNSEGDTWEYIYFLDEITYQQISYERFNRAVGYDDKNIIRGFNVLDEEKSVKAVNLLGLESEIYYPEISKEEFDRAVAEPSFDDPLEKESLVKARTEQGYLRSHLFHSKKVEKCGICEREFPVNFLVAAHIKKRSECTDDEKRDYKNIVIPMCKFGCDELYERGFFGINEGRVSINKNKFLTKSLEIFLNAINNRNCPYWSEGTRKYFEWHYNLHKNDQ